MSYLFPAVFMANSLAMTALLIVLGLAGKTVMAADIGIVQGASLALFYALSANARNLILNKTHPVSSHSIMVVRILLLVPIAGITFLLSTNFSGVDSGLAIILILRRSIEWLGEVHLSEMERAGNKKMGRNYLLAQSLLLVAAFSWILAEMPLPLLGLVVWALLPLLFSVSFIRDALSKPSSMHLRVWQRLLPHVGSTTVIGVTVYIFRLLIILIIGKSIAGDLFTAFALGGVLGSIFTSALGPSFALHESQNASRSLPLLIRLALYGSLALGATLFIITVFMPDSLDWTAKTVFFWQATSLSMIGGVVMVYAQVIRNRFLQQHKDGDVFGPDVLMNILVIAAVPFCCYLLGMQSMAALFLLNSVLAFIFYRNCECETCVHSVKSADRPYWGRITIAVAVILPLFFQLSSGVFRSPIMIYESWGILKNLPIPLSAFVCFGGILMLGEYRRASQSLNFLFFTFILMIVATVIVSHGQAHQGQAKFILLIQSILPMFGICLGQMYEPVEKMGSHYIEKAFLYTLVVIVPLQLFCTWLQGIKYLTAYFYFFSIYQHIQYVPVIFVSAYLISLYALWPLPLPKKILLFLAPLMGLYSAASLSRLATLLLLTGLLAFAIYKWIFGSEKLPGIVLLLVALICGSYFYHARNDPAFLGRNDSVFLGRHDPGNVPAFLEKAVELNKISPNILTRVVYWRYYIKQVTSSVEAFMFGHAERPDRFKYFSAYNYYLDFICNFGVLALLPMLLLLWQTIFKIYLLRREIFYLPDLVGLTAVVLFLLLIDNFLKVGLRQPYPGIFTYFIWGVLLSKLSALAPREMESAL